MASILTAVALALSAPAAASVPAPAGPAVSQGPDVEAIRAIGRKWRELYVAGRYAEIPELYTVDTMVMPRGRPRIVGREAMRRSVGGLASGRKVDIEVTEREAFVAGDYGWFVGDFDVTYTPATAGAAAHTEKGRSLIIFRRDADRVWRIHRDMDNPAPASAAAQAAAASLPGTATRVPPVWDPKSRTVAVACDRLTASRYDRTRLAPGVGRDQIDVPAAIAQCERDLAANPNDPRITFQLGRLYGYAGDRAKTRAMREASAAAGNHNAIFLLGYLDWGAAKDDGARCAAGRAMKLAADRGNYSAQLTVASYLLEGKFAPCGALVGKAEATAYVAAARPQVAGFFETRLADHLAAELAK